MDKDHRLLNVFAFEQYREPDNTVNRYMNKTSYIYLNKEIIKIDSTFNNQVYNQHRLVRTYYLNLNGLADSSISVQNDNPIGREYYHYDNENYLKSRVYGLISSGGSVCSYEGGNRVSELYPGAVHPFTNEPAGFFYTYNSLPNIIDIENFEGAFVGNLNKNLISSMYNTTGLTHPKKFNYDYKLNQEGLVVQKIITMDGSEGGFKDVKTFEYIVIKLGL